MPTFLLVLTGLLLSYVVFTVVGGAAIAALDIGSKTSSRPGQFPPPCYGPYFQGTFSLPLRSNRNRSSIHPVPKRTRFWS